MTGAELLWRKWVPWHGPTAYAGSMTRRFSWLSGLALAGLVLAGCGGSGSSSDETEQTDGGGGTNAAAAVAMSKADFGERVMVATKSAGSAHVSMSVSFAGQELASESDLTWREDGSSASRTVTSMSLGSAFEMEAIQIDDVAYLKMGELTGGKYLKVDPNDPDSPLADLYDESAGAADAGAQLEMFDEGVVDVEVVGDGGQIDSVNTTEYTVTVDVAQVLESLDSEMTAGDGADMPETFVYTVFVGDDDLIRRMTTDIAGTTMTMNFSSWGQKVEVTAPPADQVTEELDFGGLAGFDPEQLKELAG